MRTAGGDSMIWFLIASMITYLIVGVIGVAICMKYESEIPNADDGHVGVLVLLWPFLVGGANSVVV